ncbi:MAG: tRNA pseudouridine(38-40) synthase TruA [Anaeroplasmataceae bacterium]|nr:tRNA pseudouridine(38-40) synthase TruA [Anaeroplasmataceae bacterium]
MARYKITLSYDGFNYMGFQIQNALPTVELALKKAFSALIHEDVKINPSGRTDRGVHAVGQVIHVDLNVDIPTNGLKKGLNAYLPSDIFIKDVEIVNETFHARFSAVKKEYRYYINIKEYNPLTCRYSPYIPNLDLEQMRKAADVFVGTHDFKAFASASIDPRKPTVKTIYKIDINQKDGYLEFCFIGNAFLKYQIRRMMGIIVEAGKHRYTIDQILHILESLDPKESKYILDGCGLYLYQVDYDYHKE